MVGCLSNLEPHRTELNLCKFSFLLSLKGLSRSCRKAGHDARNCPSGAWSRLRADNAAERDAERSADPTSPEAQLLGASVSGLPSRATSAYTEGVAAPEPGVGVVVSAPSPLASGAVDPVASIDVAVSLSVLCDLRDNQLDELPNSNSLLSANSDSLNVNDEVSSNVSNGNNEITADSKVNSNESEVSIKRIISIEQSISN